VLEDGRLTDAKGRTVDFRNSVIIMTSNVGADLLKRESSLGFKPTGRDKSYEDMKDKVTGELRRTFRPEFLNRIDEIIVFHALDEEHIKKIVDLMIKEVAIRLAENNISIEVTDEAKEILAKEGFDKMYGARPLRRAIQRYVEDRLSEELLKGTFKTGEKVRIGANKEKEIVVEKA